MTQSILSQPEYDLMVREIAASSGLSETALQAMSECAQARMNFRFHDRDAIIRETMIYVQAWVDCFGSAKALAEAKEVPT